MILITAKASTIGVGNDGQLLMKTIVAKLSDMTGMELGPGMQEALSRLEQGEDPDQIEAEMGDVLENEDPFMLEAGKSGGRTRRRKEPARDDTLYDL